MKCNINGLDINYEDIGSGIPILCIHGFRVDHRLMSGCMEPIFEQNQSYRRIYIDLPGMGKSQSADWAANSDTILDILLQFIDIVIGEDNFLLAGESYGGYLARALIKKVPERIDGLLLICPLVNATVEQTNVPEHVILERDTSLTDTDEGFRNITVIQTEQVYKRYHKEILPGLLLGNNEFLDKVLFGAYSCSFDVNALDTPYTKPALILIAKQDSIIGYKNAWDILDNYPRATFAVLDMAGHNLQIEQPELFASLVEDWLQRVDKPNKTDKKH